MNGDNNNNMHQGKEKIKMTLIDKMVNLICFWTH